MTLRYLALGDSYTIGVGASDGSKSFPSLLAQRVEAAVGRRVDLCNPAVNGFTSVDVIRTQLDHLERFRPDLVSVLVGANDVVQNRTPEDYRESLIRIYDAVRKQKLPPGQVVAVSMPDWSAGPAARLYGDLEQLRSGIDSFNTIAREESEKRTFIFVDITELSRSEAEEPGWLAEDGLHPGDRQYQAWADHLWEVVGPVWAAL
jgi:lysophospholipase L1-like esterase